MRIAHVSMNETLGGKIENQDMIAFLEEPCSRSTATPEGWCVLCIEIDAPTSVTCGVDLGWLTGEN